MGVEGLPLVDVALCLTKLQVRLKDASEAITMQYKLSVE